MTPGADDLSRRLRSTLSDLYRRQLALEPKPYIAYHAAPQAVAARVRSFMLYRDHLPAAGRVLDWGCQHAPDACMVRAAGAGPQLELFGCDRVPPGSYPAFWEACSLQYRQVADHLRVPFDDGFFDCVIGAGVLEHVAMDYESLKELHRVLKPDGILVITHLPNRYSYTEFAARHFRRRDFHQRLYTTAGTSALLQQAGFLPLQVQRHRFLPTNSLQALTRLLAPAEGAFERVWPVNLLCGDIFAVARKVLGF